MIDRGNFALQAGKSYSTPKEALLLNGKFVIAQLSLAENAFASSKYKLGETPFVATLKEEVFCCFTSASSEFEVAKSIHARYQGSYELLRFWIGALG